MRLSDDLNSCKLVPNHPVELTMNLYEKDMNLIKTGEYAYFGVLVQYSKPGGKELEYSYYMQGYVDNNEIHLDYELDTI